MLAVRVRALLTEPSSYSARQAVARATFASIVAGIAVVLGSGLGLSLYSPNSQRRLPARPLDAHARKKVGGAKRLHSIIAARAVEAPWMVRQSATLRSLNLLLKSRPTSLPSLSSSNPDSKAGTTRFMSVNENGELQQSRPVWNEAQMALANPPKWRTLVVDAIAGGASLATGRIDVDDVDGPHKRSR
jgi:hypothetical protein